MAVVMDYYINGSTHIIIDDDCRCKNEDIEKILSRIGEIATRALCYNEEPEEKTA